MRDVMRRPARTRGPGWRSWLNSCRAGTNRPLKHPSPGRSRGRYRRPQRDAPVSRVIQRRGARTARTSSAIAACPTSFGWKSSDAVPPKNRSPTAARRHRRVPVVDRHRLPIQSPCTPGRRPCCTRRPSTAPTTAPRTRSPHAGPRHAPEPAEHGSRPRSARSSRARHRSFRAPR
jgi:hypothetical protein